MIAETIIVPLDGSRFAERAVSVATALAARTGARVLLTSTPLYDDGNHATVSEYLLGIASSAGPACEIIVPDERDPARAIVALAAHTPSAMVCMTTHGRGGLRWAVLGSVAEEVLLASAGPVLLVGPRCASDWDPGTGHVVLCHDGSSLSGLVSADACDLAISLGEHELWIATVIHPLDVEGAEHPDAVFDELESAVAARHLRTHPQLLRSSYPAGAITDLADDVPASLLVMSTHGRTGLSRVFIGSCTMGVLGLAPCPVLVRSAPRS
jgi:nucleotide-binding universal stress UspA family protein